MGTAAWDRFASFGDILYGVVVGFGFTFFPETPREDPLQAAFFLWTLAVTAQDWYQFHNLFGPQLAEGKAGQVLGRWQFFTQLGAILALYQMFVHTADATPVGWLVWAIIFLVASAWWNFITPYDGHIAFVAIDVGLAGVLAVVVASYPWLAGRLAQDVLGWGILVLVVLLSALLFGIVGPRLERAAVRKGGAGA